ncbi:hypothetical protein GU927_011380 [Rhodobacteraceae bacterium HSP-20]|uniref:Phospholipid-binding protein n=1 Tax=Paragemmobacter amnigenus TaxID=2852097 RepID=A0ABS6J4P0_9RHOB|nr:phospholipid-binding protein [Rhodobacter amnigenus]MBU9698447.1 hypothetical protein [Rhodobacter amnigenus]MBV4389674.1 hypothetical protein [Rhodobacter amnigenus]
MFRPVLFAAALSCLAPAAHAFEIAFTWDGLKLCNTGNAKTVKSPAFTIKDAPEGTAFIKFRLVDRDVPSFNHGGGVVAYDGSGTVPAGAFSYKSPCPPGEVHTYEWTATAQSKKNGGKLGVAKASRTYPE